MPRDLSNIATATVPETVVQYLNDKVPHRGPKPSHAAQKVIHGPHLSPLEISSKRAGPLPVPSPIARDVTGVTFWSQPAGRFAFKMRSVPVERQSLIFISEGKSPRRGRSSPTLRLITHRQFAASRRGTNFGR